MIISSGGGGTGPDDTLSITTAIDTLAAKGPTGDTQLSDLTSERSGSPLPMQRCDNFLGLDRRLRRATVSGAAGCLYHLTPHVRGESSPHEERSMSGEQETIDDTSPHREIAEFIAEGFANGDPVIVISTPESRRRIEAQLTSHGVRSADLVHARGSRWLDSRQVLARIFVDGMPDMSSFDKAMTGILFDGVSKSDARRIRVYHDLVDVLRDRGSLDAAVLLLRLWSKLCSQYEDLLLAYTVADWYREKDCAV